MSDLKYLIAGGAAQRRSFSAKLGVGPEHLGPLLRSVWSVKFVVLEDGLQFQVRGSLGTVVHNGALCRYAGLSARRAGGATLLYALNDRRTDTNWTDILESTIMWGSLRLAPIKQNA